MPQVANVRFTGLPGLMLSTLMVFLGCDAAYAPVAARDMNGQATGARVAPYSSLRSDITIEDQGSSLRVSYELNVEHAELRLGEGSNANPAETITAATSELTVQGRSLTASRARKTFAIRIEPDADSVGSTYPLLSRIPGEGWLLFAPHVLPPGTVRSVSFIDRAGRRTRVDRKLAQTGYLYLGTKPLRRPGFDLVAARDISTALLSSALASTDRSIAYYSRKMGRPPVSRPLVVLTHAEGTANRGDVSDNGVVFIRLARTEILSPDAIQFLAHELFHLWTDTLPRDQTDWWLQEGAAEYASWLALDEVNSGAPSLSERVSTALKDCSFMLQDQQIARLSPMAMSRARYTCGATAYWLADVAARARGDDVFAVLKETWPTRAAPDAAGLRTRFEEAVGKRSAEAADVVRQVVSGSGTARWQALSRTASSLGAEVQALRPSPFMVRLAATKALVLSACGSVTGIGERNGTLFASSLPDCRIFADGPTIRSVEGIDPMTAPQQYFDLISARCRSGSPVSVELERAGARTTSKITCRAPIVPPTPELRVSRAR